jgi:hypothetical protein
MSKIYYVYDEGDDEHGEIDGFFNEEGNLIHAWACNDAIWRPEYQTPLLEKLGFEVIRPEGKLEKKLIKKLRTMMDQ